MTDVTINAIIIAIPTTLVALATFIQSIRNGRKTEETSAKVEEVRVLADGHLTKQTSALDNANERIAGMERLLASVTEQLNSAKIAAALATPVPVTMPSEPLKEAVSEALKEASPIPVVIRKEEK